MNVILYVYFQIRIKQYFSYKFEESYLFECQNFATPINLWNIKL